jgi:hypothetical protein
MIPNICYVTPRILSSVSYPCDCSTLVILHNPHGLGAWWMTRHMYLSAYAGACVCVCACLCVLECVWMCLYTMCLCVCVYLYVCLCVLVCVYVCFVCVCLCIYLYGVCMYVRGHVCTYVCACMCILLYADAFALYTFPTWFYVSVYRPSIFTILTAFKCIISIELLFIII